MSSSQIALLGAIAGFTIFLGLPVGRLRQPAVHLKAGLNGVAIGVLVFLFSDIVTNAWEPSDAALATHHWADAAVGGIVMTLGVTAGMVGLVYYDRWMAARRARQMVVAAQVPVSVGRTKAWGVSDGPPAAPVGVRRPARSAAAELALMIAVGSGLHNSRRAWPSATPPLPASSHWQYCS